MFWHIMNIYTAYGFKEFVIALGCKGEIIKDYFINYHLRSRILTVQSQTDEVSIHNGTGAGWTGELLLKKLGQEGKARWKLWN